MALVTLAQVQQWLEQSKLQLSAIDAELADTARDVTFAALVNSYTTSTWVSTATTPRLVRSVISMLVAAWEYQRAYSEDAGDALYGIELERKAMALLAGISAGTTTLEEYPGVGANAETLGFYPDDATGALEDTDGLGYEVGVAGSMDRKFRVSSRF